MGDSGLWGATAVTLALVAAFLGEDGFIAVRLMSQALFGELVALTAWIAVLFWRRGRRPWAAVVALACTTLLAAYAEAYHREPTDLQVRRYAVDVTRGARSAGASGSRSSRTSRPTASVPTRSGRSAPPRV